MNQSVAAGGGERRAVEVEARTVDEAVARGLVRLGGLSRSEVEIEVLDEGRSGVLGFGAAPVRVRLTERGPASPKSEAKRSGGARASRGRAKDEAPAGPEVAEDQAEKAETSLPAMGPEERAEAEEVAREVVGQMLRLLGYEEVGFEVRSSLLPESMDGEDSLVLSIQGPGTERLLTDGARPLNALQFLARLVMSRKTGRWANLLLDVGSDRARRMQELVQLAEQSALLVEREGRPVSLPPMTAYERRVVHLALRNHTRIATQSIGSGEFRKVTVRRADQLLPEA
jgi:spoIIIJ-associated protein